MKMTEDNYDREKDQIKSDTTQQKETSESQTQTDVFNDDLLAISEMSTKDRMSYKWKRLQKRLETMEPAEKRKYIIHYYKFHFLIALVALVLLVASGMKIYDNSLPVDLFVIIANDFNLEREEAVPDVIETAYRDRYATPKNHKIEVVEQMDLSGDIYQEESYVSSIQVWAYIKDDDLDIIIGNPSAMEYMTKDNSILPLDEYLPEDLYQQVENRIVMCEDNEEKMVRNGEKFPGAIDISDTEMAKRMNLSYKEVYIILPSNRKENIQRSVNFIKLALDLQ